MSSQGGGPRLTLQDVCLLCLKDQLDAILASEDVAVNREKFLALSKDLEAEDQSMDRDGVGYFVGRHWLRYVIYSIISDNIVSDSIFAIFIVEDGKTKRGFLWETHLQQQVLCVPMEALYQIFLAAQAAKSSYPETFGNT